MQLKRLIVGVLLQVIGCVPQGNGQTTQPKNETVHVYLLRGLTRESGHWGTQFEDSLRKQIPNCSVHYLDLPGAGIFFEEKSPKRVSKMVEFIRNRYIDSLMESAGRNILVATSLGSMVASQWAIQHPYDFQALILICPSYKNVCRLKERAQPEVRREMFQSIFASDVTKREGILLKINSNDSLNYERNLTMWVKIQKDRPMSKGNTLRQTIAGMRYKLDQSLPEIPILIVGSKGDRVVSTACIQAVHEKIGGDLILHETSGHGIPVDAAPWLANQIALWANDHLKSTPEIPAFQPILSSVGKIK
jgi:pimeloyl-ACP methyl ester carboxylesterase